MRPCEPNIQDPSGFRGFAASVLLHGLFLFALLSIAPKLLPPLEPEDPIEVDFIPLPPLPAAPPVQAPIIAAPAPQQAVPETAPAPSPPEAAKDDGMVHSSRIYSGAVLTQKGNEEALTDYRNLSVDEQREQLCSLETLEQIAAWNKAYKPERMITYTFEEVIYEGNHMIANGAVFWSHDNWHRVKFDCELSPDQSKVVDLAFAVGTIVPKSDWEDHYLTQYK